MDAEPTPKIRCRLILLAHCARFLLLGLVLAVISACSGASGAAMEMSGGTYAAKDPREVGSPVLRTTPDMVEVNLVAKEVIADLAEGKRYAFWTFNGTVPGPLIRVMEGDTVEVTFTNDLNSVEPHNLDFHAAIGPGGGAAVTNVEPGETRIFRFKAMRRGAYIYHCAGEGMPWEHVAHGMYGLILVEPPGGLEPGFKEFYIGQSDWYVSQRNAANGTDEDGGVSGGDGPELVFDDDKASDELASYYSFNGHAKALSDPAIFGSAITVNQDDQVRLFFVNAGPNKTSSFHMIGAIFDKVYPGHPDDFVRNEETVSVPPGSAVVMELQVPVPGMYQFVDHALFRVPKGAAGTLTVMPAVGPTLDNPVGSWPEDLYDPPAFDSMGH